MRAVTGITCCLALLAAAACDDLPLEDDDWRWFKLASGTARVTDPDGLTDQVILHRMEHPLQGYRPGSDPYLEVDILKRSQAGRITVLGELSLEFDRPVSAAGTYTVQWAKLSRSGQTTEECYSTGCTGSTLKGTLKVTSARVTPPRCPEGIYYGQRSDQVLISASLEFEARSRSGHIVRLQDGTLQLRGGFRHYPAPSR